MKQWWRKNDDIFIINEDKKENKHVSKPIPTIELIKNTNMSLYQIEKKLYFKCIDMIIFTI